MLVYDTMSIVTQILVYLYEVGSEF